MTEAVSALILSKSRLWEHFLLIEADQLSGNILETLKLFQRLFKPLESFKDTVKVKFFLKDSAVCECVHDYNTSEKAGFSLRFFPQAAGSILIRTEGEASDVLREGGWPALKSG